MMPGEQLLRLPVPTRLPRLAQADPHPRYRRTEGVPRATGLHRRALRTFLADLWIVTRPGGKPFLMADMIKGEGGRRYVIISAAATVLPVPLHGTERSELPMLPHSTQLPLLLEDWQPIVGYEGWYEVSTLGRVRRLQPSNNTYVGRILKPTIDGHGYPTVSLCRDGISKTAHLHHLVSRTFLAPQPEGYEPNHKDGDKTNNAVSNLEWLTRSENQKHAVALGLQVLPRGEDHPNAKLTTAEAKTIRSLGGKVSRAKLAEVYGISPPEVSRIQNGTRWRCLSSAPGEDGSG